MTASVNLVPIIEKKKYGQALTDAEIQTWITAVSEGVAPDYQSAALLMAIRLNGMNFDETLALTNAMADSGERLAFTGYPHLGDKHSTGGVGDKVTPILAPLMAACGLPVTMLSGRGLGFSGGTIDKFESIEGVTCSHDQASMQAMIDQLGWANAMASEQIAPADRVLYALRDVTGTVDSIPLITASILSKKLAGGATHLVMDVKCGHGAFMQTREDAVALAQNLSTIGNMGGLGVEGVISRMDEPLGQAVGNYLEMLESVAYLREIPDTPLGELVLVLGSMMLHQGGLAQDDASALALMKARIADGRALDKLNAYLSFCGASDAAVTKLNGDRIANFPSTALAAQKDGVVTDIKSRRLGELLIPQGAGRATKDDRIDPMAGLVLKVAPGTAVNRGDVLAELHGAKAASLQTSEADHFAACFEIEDEHAHTHKSVVLTRF